MELVCICAVQCCATPKPTATDAAVAEVGCILSLFAGGGGAAHGGGAAGRDEAVDSTKTPRARHQAPQSALHRASKTQSLGNNGARGGHTFLYHLPAGLACSRDFFYLRIYLQLWC